MKAPPKNLPFEIQHLLRELQIHQGDLEIQNKELRLALTALQTSRNNYYELFNFAPVPFLSLSPDARILEANMAASELLKIERRFLPGKSFLTFLDPDSRKSFLAHLEAAFKTELRQCDKFILLQRSSSNPIYTQIYSDALLEPIPQAKVAILDITPQVLAQHDLEKLNQTLETKIQERTAQAETQALKLRELALAVTLSADAERKRLAQVLHDHLQQLMIAAKMSTDQILKISKAGPAPRQKTSTLAQDVQRFIMSAIDTSRSLTVELYPPVLKEAGLSAALEWLGRWFEEKYDIKMDLIGRGCFKKGHDADVFLFEAARECLLNAVKHAGVRHIDVYLEQEQDQVRLCISDKGKGFNPNQVRPPDSSGHFGLSNLRERAVLMGGEMQIESQIGKGTQVYIRIPYKVSLTELPEEIPAFAITDTEKAGKPNRIRLLAVDDHKLFRQGLLHVLSSDPEIEVIGEAKSGIEAINLSKSLRPDIVLMDINIPDVNGIEATRQICSHPFPPRVIGLSFHDENEIVQAMRNAGACAYINKASAAEELLSTIHSFYTAT